MEEAVNFLDKGLFHPSILTSARFPLFQGEEAFKVAKDPDSLKVLLNISGPRGA